MRYPHSTATVLAVVVAFAALTPTASRSQSSEEPKTDRAGLIDLSNRFKQTLQRERPPLYYELLASQDPVVRRLNENPDIKLIRISEHGPEYYTIHNLNAAKTISTDDIWPGSPFPFPQKGIGTLPGKLAIWDAGGVNMFHEEYVGRIVPRNVVSTHYHSAHVAGTMIAEGVVPHAKGMSYGAESLDSYDWEDDVVEMADAAADGLQISNHSYGWLRGWTNYLGYWYWYGPVDISPAEDYLFGFYDETTVAWDAIATKAPYYLIVTSAGNERNDDSPGLYAQHYHRTSDGDWESATDYHQEDGFSGYDTIAQQGVAKNILTVGAVEKIPGGYTEPGDVVIAPFSSWGPSDDGRIKPDLVADGVDVISMGVWAASYDTLSGTSMAAPGVSGSLNLIARLFEAEHGKQPLASTLKALAINGTDEAGYSDGPDYVHGWGLMNTKTSATVTYSHEYSDMGVGEAWLTAGDVDYYYFTVPSVRDVRVTLVWTDPPGTPPAPALDPPTPMLVHDLDLRVEHVGATTYLPWRMNHFLPANPATQADNTLDNVEQVDIASAPAGTYIVRVNYKGNFTAPRQWYSMAWQGLVPAQPVAIGGLDNGSHVELRPVDAAVKSPASTDNQERGAFVTAVHDFDLFTAGIKLALTSPTTIIAKVYEAVGTTRGALVATGTLTDVYHPGEVFYYVPISASLIACEDYEIVFQFGAVRHWWYWDESTITLPFNRGGVVLVRDGSEGGDAAATELVHMDLVGNAPDPDAVADLTPPATTWDACGDTSERRGVYIRAERTLFVHHVVWRANYPAFSDITLRANIYEATGTTRVFLLASGVVKPLVTTSGMRDFVIPVNAVLREGLNYDIEVEFTPATWECKSEAAFTLPFTIGGVIRVIDGEAGGDAGNSILPHLKIGWSEGAGGSPVDLGKLHDPTTYSVSQNNYDYGLFVTSITDQNVHSLGWYADVPEGAIIGARIYDAVGSTRGALLATGVAVSSSSGSRWHDVPITAHLDADQDYDLEIDIREVNTFDYWLDFSGMGYLAGGTVLVRDGEQGGNGANAAVIHMRLNNCEAIPTGVTDRGPEGAPRFALHAPYPNPTRGSSRIAYSLDGPATVSLEVYDVAGRRVSTLVRGEYRPGGLSEFNWDPSRLAAGVYFLKLSTPAKSVSRKITLVR